MRVILSAAGRAALRDAAVAFLVFAGGIFTAPNVDQARALAIAGVIAAFVAAVRAVRVFVPSIAKGIATMLHVPTSVAETVVTGLTTFLVGFLVMLEGVGEAMPNYGAAKAAAVAGILALGTALVRFASALLTPGEAPADGAGIETPPQPVPAAALPTPMPAGPNP